MGYFSKQNLELKAVFINLIFFIEILKEAIQIIEEVQIF
jgi:hypothetical protein